MIEQFVIECHHCNSAGTGSPRVLGHGLKLHQCPIDLPQSHDTTMNLGDSILVFLAHNIKRIEYLEVVVAQMTPVIGDRMCAVVFRSIEKSCH